jgi:hypothetical protein
VGAHGQGGHEGRPYGSALMFIVTCGYWRRIAADLAREIQEAARDKEQWRVGIVSP